MNPLQRSRRRKRNRCGCEPARGQVLCDIWNAWPPVIWYKKLFRGLGFLMQAREGEYVDVGLAAGDHHKMRDFEYKGESIEK